LSDFLAVLAVGLGTYGSRAVFILALANRKIPAAILMALQFVAPAVLGALIVALLINSEGEVSAEWPEAAAFLMGGLVAWKTRNHIYTLFAGMGAFWLVRGLVG